MTYTLKLTYQPTEVLYEDVMDVVSSSERGFSQNSVQATGPLVTFGVPQCHNLLNLLKEQGKSLPPDILLMSREADFYFVQFAISFRPKINTRLDWIQFVVYLRAEKAGYGEPIAYDLYPQAIINDEKAELKLEISPEIKFSGIDLKVGSANALIEYKKSTPFVTCSGLLEAAPTWEFRHQNSHPLQGSMKCCAIIKKPKKCGGVRATLDVMAQIVGTDWVLNARRKQSHNTHCSHIICKDNK